MKNKKIVLISSILFLIAEGAVLNLNGDNSVVELFKSPRDKQLDYLKKHEQEIIEWMISKYPKVESIQFDWNTLRVGPVSNGIITKYYNLSVKGKFNHNPDTYIQIDFRLNKAEDIPSIERMGMNQHPMIHRDGGLYIYE